MNDRNSKYHRPPVAKDYGGGGGGGESTALLLGAGVPVEEADLVTRSYHQCTRACSAIGFVLVLAALALAGVGIWYGTNNYYIRIGQDSVRSGHIGANTQISLGPVFGVASHCTATFIRRTGHLVTATHCLQDDDFCLFDGTNIPLVAGPRYVQVHNVNGTGERWIMEVDLVGWSGITDVAVLRTRELITANGGVINLVTQPFLGWGDSAALNRGEEAMALTYSANFVKHLVAKGAVQAPDVECTDAAGGGICTGVERVHVDTSAVAGGASGSAFTDRNGLIVMAPVTWSFSVGGDAFSVAGTSQRVAQPLTDRMIDPNLSPNGSGGQYLVPTLGIIPLGALGTQTLFASGPGGGPADFPYVQIEGYMTAALADQDAYDFAQFMSTMVCGGPIPPGHVVTPPSILGAPVNVIDWGAPPDPFPALDGSYSVIIAAIETEVDSGRFVTLGEHAGLGTVSGQLIGAGRWAGDVVRVRVRRFDPTDDANPLKNWQAVYRVTLQAVDPYLDGLLPFYSLVSPAYLFDPGTQSIYHAPASTLRAAPLLHTRGARMQSHVLEIPAEGMNVAVMKPMPQVYHEFLQTVRRKRLARGIKKQK